MAQIDVSVYDTLLSDLRRQKALVEDQQLIIQQANHILNNLLHLLTEKESHLPDWMQQPLSRYNIAENVLRELADAKITKVWHILMYQPYRWIPEMHAALQAVMAVHQTEAMLHGFNKK